MSIASEQKMSVNEIRVGGGDGQESPFGRPQGWLGRLVGRLMAKKNRPMNDLAVELLHVDAEDSVLEIGFGPGTAVERIAETTDAACIAGVDPSDVMVAQAVGRNGRWVREGRVDLRRGTAEELPFDDGTFTKIYAVNSFHHWTHQRNGLREVRRVLREGGTLLFCLRMELEEQKRFAAPGLTDAQVDEIEAMLRDSGFREIERVERQVGRRAVCLIAKG